MIPSQALEGDDSQEWPLEQFNCDRTEHLAAANTAAEQQSQRSPAAGQPGDEFTTTRIPEALARTRVEFLNGVCTRNAGYAAIRTWNGIEAVVASAGGPRRRRPRQPRRAGERRFHRRSSAGQG